MQDTRTVPRTMKTTGREARLSEADRKHWHVVRGAVVVPCRRPFRKDGSRLRNYGPQATSAGRPSVFASGRVAALVGRSGEYRSTEAYDYAHPFPHCAALCVCIHLTLSEGGHVRPTIL
ncbi:hypothetical protein MRX96_041167 [Rhipicephalus microplus]